MKGLIVIVPCGQGKIWDKVPNRGATPARDAYTGSPFKVNREYAERFAERWVILSAKYGFIDPDYKIDGPYNVTFKKLNTLPVKLDVLKKQVRELGLGGYSTVIGLGGKEYRAMIESALGGNESNICFPFAGLPIGKMMSATKRAIGSSQPLPSV